MSRPVIDSYCEDRLRQSPGAISMYRISYGSSTVPTACTKKYKRELQGDVVHSAIKGNIYYAYKEINASHPGCDTGIISSQDGNDYEVSIKVIDLIKALVLYSAGCNPILHKSIQAVIRDIVYAATGVKRPRSLKKPEYYSLLISDISGLLEEVGVSL